MNRLQTKFLGVDFKNPIVTSSGCFGFGLEYRDYFDPNILGGIGIKGLTLEALSTPLIASAPVTANA